MICACPSPAADAPVPMAALTALRVLDHASDFTRPPEEPASVEGNLTMLGVTKPVTLTLERWKCGPRTTTSGPPP